MTDAAETHFQENSRRYVVAVLFSIRNKGTSIFHSLSLSLLTSTRSWELAEHLSCGHLGSQGASGDRVMRRPK